MKKTIKLAVVAALALGATSAFATNGAALIGMGAKTRGMAGTGIGMSHGAESALINPALITSVENTEISFGGTIFMPDVKNTNNLGGPDSDANSDADLNVIPEVSLATKINDNFYAGIGMWGTGGMGVDYRETAIDTAGGTQLNMVTNLQIMQFGVPLAYTTNGFSVAVTPILQYGSLDVNYVYTGAPLATGMGVAQDLQFGFNLGAAYTISNFTVGAVYKSRIDMEYKGFASVIGNFSAGAYDNNELSTPAEIGIGASYTMDEHTVAIDYKQIQWSDAKGYEDFEWDDQNVIALGYEYKTTGWAVRLGYNYASSPISEQNNATPNAAGLTGGVINTFNLLGFPGIVESHYAIGGTYNVSDKASVDVAYTYAAENTETYKNFVGQDITTKHSQNGVSVQLNYDF